MIELSWNVPINEVRMGEYLEALELPAGGHVLDVGCGCGELLIRACERGEVRGLGVDSSGEHVEEARRRAELRLPDGVVHFEEADARSFHVEPASFDAVLCMGATHAFGLGADAYRHALERMTPLLLPGGRLLVGEGYARQPADPEYRRRFLGETTPDGMTHEANVRCGRLLGLVPLGAWTSSVAEWDDFEWLYQRLVERHSADRPVAVDLRERLAQRREWMDGYLRWGRETLGFGVYLFERPGVAPTAS